MPTARATRSIPASRESLWAVVADPHHLPRWWPRVERVEDVRAGAFTEVMRTSRGRIVRADFRMLRTDRPEGTVAWAQQVQGTPFESVLRSAETELRLAAPAGPGAAAATEVTIELRQTLTGFFARLGGVMVRRAAHRTLHEALDGLERISA